MTTPDTPEDTTELFPPTPEEMFASATTASNRLRDDIASRQAQIAELRAQIVVDREALKAWERITRAQHPRKRTSKSKADSK